LKFLLQVSHRNLSWPLLPPLAGRKLAITSLFIQQRGHWRSLARIDTLRISKAFGAWLEVGDGRFSSSEIQRLYEAGDYPLRKCSE